MILYRMIWCCNIWNANMSYDMIQFCLIQYDIVSYDVVSYILFHDTIWYCIKARNNIYYFDKRSLTMIYIYYDQGGFRFYKGDAFSRRAFWSVIIHVSVWYRIGVYMYQNLNTLWFCLITFLGGFLRKLQSSYVLLYNYVYIFSTALLRFADGW